MPCHAPGGGRGRPRAPARRCGGHRGALAGEVDAARHRLADDGRACVGGERHGEREGDDGRPEQERQRAPEGREEITRAHRRIVEDRHEHDRRDEPARRVDDRVEQGVAAGKVLEGHRGVADHGVRAVRGRGVGPPVDRGEPRREVNAGRHEAGRQHDGLDHEHEPRRTPEARRERDRHHGAEHEPEAENDHDRPTNDTPMLHDDSCTDGRGRAPCARPAPRTSSTVPRPGSRRSTARVGSRRP
jgi:hypothetical protein